MAKLIRNVFAAGEWWGPAHGRVDPPAEVAAEITNPACWDEPPAGTPLTAEEAAEAAAREAAPALGFAPGRTITYADYDPSLPVTLPDGSVLPPQADPVSEAEGILHDLPPVPDPTGDATPLDEVVEQVTASVAEELAALPDDRDVLAAFAERHGLEVDGRLGAAKLRAALAAQIRG